MSREDDISRLLPYLYSREQAAATARSIADFVDARIREAIVTLEKRMADVEAALRQGMTLLSDARIAVGVSVHPEAAAHKTTAGDAGRTSGTNVLPADYPAEPALSPLSECEASPACPHPAPDHVAGRHFCARHLESLGKEYREPALPKPAPVGADEWPPVRVALYCDMMRSPPLGIPMNGEDSVDYVRADVHEKAVGMLRALVESLPTCDVHGDPATRAFERGGRRYCDACGVGLVQCDAPDYPRAVPLRAAVAFLSAHDSASTRK